MFLPLYLPIHTPEPVYQGELGTTMNFTTLRPPPPSQVQSVSKEGEEKDADVSDLRISSNFAAESLLSSSYYCGY